MSFQIGVVQKKKLFLYEFTGRFSMIKVRIPDYPYGCTSIEPDKVLVIS
jgi:hypothetical protein